MDDEQYEKAIRAEKKPKKERTPEEQADIDRKNTLKKQRKSMISVLRGISIRIPMMIYGMDIDIDQNVDINKFVDLVDAQSWSEFMPQGITKDKFRQISKYYDPEVFVEAGRIIRHRVKELDQLDPIERTLQIADVFSTFKNPDKETVLTPWRVVNMQLGKTIGGYCFFDDAYQNSTKDGKQIAEWRTTDLTDQIFNNDAHNLEINSKTGLYPLYVATSLYYQEFQKLNEITAGKFSVQDLEDLWANILDQNVFAVAKTPMAKTIAERTLTGYRNHKTHVVYVDDIVETARQSIDAGVKKIKEAFKYMKFDVVIGNPPYQQEGNGDTARAEPIYHLFMDMAYALAPKVVLITPARFLFNAGQTPKAWNTTMLSDPHLRVVAYEPKSANIFPNTDIKGGLAITLRDTDMDFGAIEQFVPYSEVKSIIERVRSRTDFVSLSTIVAPRGQYRFSELFFEENPSAKKMIGVGTGNMVASNAFEKLAFAFLTDDTKRKPYLRILGRKQAKRVYKLILRGYLIPNNCIDTFNLAITEANGSGDFGERLTETVVLNPGEICTDTFISIGAFSDKSQAQNLAKYLKTKFARALLSVRKVTQHNPNSVWAEIPLQDFTSASDVEWSASVEGIDKQLYLKYELSQAEQEFISNNVQVMN